MIEDYSEKLVSAEDRHRNCDENGVAQVQAQTQVQEQSPASPTGASYEIVEDSNDTYLSEQKNQAAAHIQEISNQIIKKDRFCKEPGTFLIPNSNPPKCRPLLTCQDIEEQITYVDKVVAHGSFKQIKVGKYFYDRENANDLNNSENFYKVAYMVGYRPPFFEGLNNLLEFQGYKSVIPVLGFCKKPEGEDSIMITEFCDHADLETFINKSEDYKSFDILGRMKLTLSFLKAFRFFHNSPLGATMMCATKAANMGLDQFLVSNENYEVLINDIDNLPLVKDHILCPNYFDIFVIKGGPFL